MIRETSDDWPGADRAVVVCGPVRSWRCEECGARKFRDSGRCSNDECSGGDDE